MEIEYRETSGSIPGEDKKAAMKMSGTTIQVVISKKFSLLTLYGAAGYNIAKSNLGVKGVSLMMTGNIQQMKLTL